mgnify:CR=1 FL=1
MQIGSWRVDLVRGGDFWLDGGVVFGIVPRTLWAGIYPPDTQNRIRIANHCLLARNGRQTVLIDTGNGTKWSPLDRRFYGLEAGDPLIESLRSLSVEPDEVDLVVFSHLHRDHVGGASHWDAGRRAVVTFRRARHLVGRREWEDAIGQAPELQTAYPREHLTPLEAAGLVETIDENSEILPGLRASHTGGHTRGHMAILFEAADSGLLFIGDLCATSSHLHPMWNLAYDTFPLDTRRVKPRLLAEAAARKWWVVWPHDPQLAAARLEHRANKSPVVIDPRVSL